MGDHNDNLLNGRATEPKVSIIKRPENVGLINNKFKKVNTFLPTKFAWRGVGDQ